VPYSQAAFLALIRLGRPREQAYRLVQAASRAALDSETHLRAVLEADPAMGLDGPTLDQCFSPAAHLARAKVVFERLEGATLG